MGAMKTTLLLLALLAPQAPAGWAQQSAPIQPPSLQAPVKPAPCVPSKPKLPRWTKVQAPPWLQKQLARQQAKTGTTVDPNAPIQDALKPAPCPATKAAPAPLPATSAKQPAVPVKDSVAKPPAPAAPAAAPSNKPATAYVCPPKSTLIPNYPYCVFPDHSVVDAIPLPANLSAPAAAAQNQSQH